jgi:hypothetical protein
MGWFEVSWTCGIYKVAVGSAPWVLGGLCSGRKVIHLFLPGSIPRLGGLIKGQYCQTMLVILYKICTKTCKKYEHNIL